MTVPRKPSQKQAPRTIPAPDITLTFPANDHAVVPGVTPDGPEVCPTCHRPWFPPTASLVLDLLVTAHEATQTAQECLRTLKATVERTVVP
jgi:hypothetical protein